MKSILSVIILSFIMMGCTNSANSSQSISEETETAENEGDKFSAHVAIVSKDIDFFYCYGEKEGISKRPQKLSPGAYPIRCKRGDLWDIGVGQDGGFIKMSDCKDEIWTAEEGHGYVLPVTDRFDPIKIAVHVSPDDMAEVIDTLAFENSIGEPCLGRENGWLKIEINKNIGYVKEGEGIWSIHVFDYCGMIR